MLTVALIWGVTYVAMRVGMQHSPPFFFAMARTFLGGALLCALALAVSREVPRGWAAHAGLAVGGALNYGVFYAGMHYGVVYLSAGETAILNYTGPLWMAVIARLALGQALTPLRVGGLALGFAGVALLVGEKLLPGTHPAWDAYALLLVGAFSWAAGSVFFVRHLGGFALEWAAGLQSLYGSATLLLGWLLLEGAGGPDWGIEFWKSFGVAVILASFVAQLAYFTLLRRREAAVVGSYIFLVPVFAAISGFLLLGEPIGLLSALGGVCVVVGIIFVNRPVTVANTSD